MNPPLIAIGVVVAVAFTVSAISWGKERSTWSFFQLLGAGFWIVVVFAHIAETFHLLPEMGWGLPNSTGHYLDLISALAGLILFPAGYFARRLTKRRTSH